MICRQYKLNVLAERKSKRKLKIPNLSQDERDYLRSVVPLNWFTGKVASVLIEIEAKGKEVTA